MARGRRPLLILNPSSVLSRISTVPWRDFRNTVGMLTDWNAAWARCPRPRLVQKDAAEDVYRIAEEVRERVAGPLIRDGVPPSTEARTAAVDRIMYVRDRLRRLVPHLRDSGPIDNLRRALDLMLHFLDLYVHPHSSPSAGTVGSLTQIIAARCAEMVDGDLILQIEQRWRVIDAAGGVVQDEDLTLAFQALWDVGAHEKAYEFMDEHTRSV